MGTNSLHKVLQALLENSITHFSMLELKFSFGREKVGAIKALLL